MKKLIPVLVFGLVTAATAEMSFQGIGDTAGGVSGDGSTVIGVRGSWWTQDSGWDSIGSLPGGGDTTYTDDVSYDGSIIVGLSYSSNGREAYQWTQESGLVSLGDLPGGVVLGRATSISSDGSVIAGWSRSDPSNLAFRWTQSEGMVSLGALPDYNSSLATDVSADGSTIVGYVPGNNVAYTQPFKWNVSEGMVGLGIQGSAQAVSADGSIIVGHGVNAPFLWSEENGITDLATGDMELDASIYIHDMTPDGSVVIGEGYEAMLWDAGTAHWKSLKEVLIAGGVDMTGWELNSARGISDDGRIVVGNATYLDGSSEGFIAVIPEPASLGLIFIFTGGIYFVHRLFV